MRTASKLSAEERRAAIIKAVRKVFAEKGFHGTTTRALADAAGVSEALLFKHFPTKEALFSAMQVSCCSEQDAGRFERIAALEPSASTLSPCRVTCARWWRTSRTLSPSLPIARVWSW